MIDLSDVTFIVPVRIDSHDRLRNVLMTSSYLLKNFNCKVIIKSSDTSDNLQHWIDLIKSQIPNPDNLLYIFEHTNDNVFHRTKILNDMILLSETDIVVNYDCDILLPINSYIESSRLINEEGYDLVYPFRFGSYGASMIQLSNSLIDPVVSRFINEVDLTTLLPLSVYRQTFDGEGYAEYGFCQFFKKESYINGYFENENFLAYGPEDVERYHRWYKLGYNIGRIDDTVYHLEHARSENSWFTNPYLSHNSSLWDYIRSLDKNELINYYENQEYYIKRKSSIV